MAGVGSGVRWLVCRVRSEVAGVRVRSEVAGSAGSGVRWLV